MSDLTQLTRGDVVPSPGDWEGMWREAEAERLSAVAACDRLRVALAGAMVEMRDAAERMKEAGGGGFTEGELRRAADVVEEALNA